MNLQKTSLGELTRRELANYLESDGSGTMLVPMGAIEQHGDHAPLATDIIIPQEVCRRVSGHVGALVAPGIPYGLSQAHRGSVGEISLSIDTYINLVADLARGFSRTGVRRIVFLNGHYDNTHAIAYGCAKAADDMPADTAAFPINYWDGLEEDKLEEYLSPRVGFHANVGETSAVMAINKELIALKNASREFPAFPEVRGDAAAARVALFLAKPGSFSRAIKTGVWGDPGQSSEQLGEKFLEWIAEGVVQQLQDIDAMHAAAPPGSNEEERH